MYLVEIGVITQLPRGKGFVESGDFIYNKRYDRYETVLNVKEEPGGGQIIKVGFGKGNRIESFYNVREQRNLRNRNLQLVDWRDGKKVWEFVNKK